MLQEQITLGYIARPETSYGCPKLYASDFLG